MRLLLDTCTFLWLVGSPGKLSPAARSLVADFGHDLLLSSVSAWEITIKWKLGGLSLSESPDRFVPKYRALHSISELSLDELSVMQLVRLPDLHRDPFDRMLICQAIAHGLAIVTPDPLLTQYPVRVLW